MFLVCCSLQRLQASLGVKSQLLSWHAECRKLAKKVQTELAEANSVAEEVITSMPTVKAHAAELSASASYSARLAKFFKLQVFVELQIQNCLLADSGRACWWQL